MTDLKDEPTTSGVHVFPDGPHAHDHAAAEPAAEPVALRTDGPTLAEWVAAGYAAENYPPHGYAPKDAATPAPAKSAPVSDRHGRTVRPGALTADSTG
jgi:hypothetical protein